MKQFKSFYDWCVESGHIDYIDLWNNELNGVSSKDVPFQSNKKYYFNCINHNNQHNPELKRLDNIVHQPNSIKCKACLSFGQYLKDIHMYEYWSNNNNIDPFCIPKNYNKKILMICDKVDYHGEYLVSCNHFVDGNRCPYCSSKLVHRNDSLGNLYPESINIWSDKNKKDAYEYTPHSNKKVWWVCPKGIHDDYYKAINVMTRDGYHCPFCSNESKNSYLQNKVKEYFTDLGYTVKNEYECNIIPISPITNRKLPYDNEIVDLKLICEVHGSQHYIMNCGWYKHKAEYEEITLEEVFEKRKYYDEYKKSYAEEHGYFYLAIPYWEEKNDNYKKIINEKIQEIKSIKK